MINPASPAVRAPHAWRATSRSATSCASSASIAPGTAAEYVVVPAENLARVPPEMPWDQAAAFSLATLTAWRMLTTRAGTPAGRDRADLGHRRRRGAGGAADRPKLLGARTIVTSGHRRQAGGRPAARRRRGDQPRDGRRRGGGPRAHRRTGSGRRRGQRRRGHAGRTRSARSAAAGGWSICGATTGPMVVARSPAPLLAPVEHPRLHHGQPARVRRDRAARPRRPPLAGGGSGGAARRVAAARCARLERGEQIGKLVIEVAP